jgi:hypothetical protein
LSLLKSVQPPHRCRARAATSVERKRQAREWDERYGKLTDLSAFQRDPPPHPGRPAQQLPAGDRTIAPLRIPDPAREKTPHPQHWYGLLEAAGTGLIDPIRHVWWRRTECAGMA